MFGTIVFNITPLCLKANITDHLKSTKSPGWGITQLTEVTKSHLRVLGPGGSKPSRDQNKRRKLPWKDIFLVKKLQSEFCVLNTNKIAGLISFGVCHPVQTVDFIYFSESNFYFHAFKWLMVKITIEIKYAISFKEPYEVRKALLALQMRKPNHREVR